MTRDEHLAWCKWRALEYVEINDLQQAVISMMSDLDKHQETKNHARIMLGTMLLITRKFSTKEEVIKFINEFN